MLISLQGLVVSLLFCLLNTEVRHHLGPAWRRLLGRAAGATYSTVITNYSFVKSGVSEAAAAAGRNSFSLQGRARRSVGEAAGGGGPGGAARKSVVEAGGGGPGGATRKSVREALPETTPMLSTTVRTNEGGGVGSTQL